jgi:tRNA threonylcarbamoyl adenosine modification protein YjeE
MGSERMLELPTEASAGTDALWRLTLADETVTQRLAAEIALLVRAGDLVTLSGDLGAGKTTFARALIRAILQQPDLDVVSPTFTLMQTYDGPDFPIVHIDLYRIEQASELAEIGWEEAGEGALVLVEWPERAGEAMLADRLDMSFYLDAEESPTRRLVTLRGIGSFGPRLAHAKAVHDLLKQADWADAARLFMLGDASTRAYERLTKPDGRTAILMSLPARPRVPLLRNGKTYAEIARLSHHVDAFIAMDGGLRERGFSAPEIYAADRVEGLAVLEDLGSEPVVDADGPMPDRFAEATALLAKLHELDLPATLPLAEEGTYAIPPYDLDALLVEVELLFEWYAPHIAKITLAASTRQTFMGLWKAAIGELFAATPKLTWTLRDYHSPNLIWLPQREGLARLGLIDFQDCVLGPPAYDVASLLQDARVTVPDQLELRLIGQYAQARRRADPQFDTAAFARAYAIAGAQRATKLLGLFTRLDRRDRKPQYLPHLPRIERYLAKGLGHPVLSELKAWYENHLPRALVQTA